MKKKKVISLLLCAALTAGALFGAAACGEEGEQGEALPEIDPNITATLSLGVKGDNLEEEIAHSLGDTFRQKFPNVTVKYVSMAGNTVNAIDKLNGNGGVPDVFLANSFDMLTLNSMGLLYDFSGVISAEEKAGTFDLDDYYNVYFELGQENFNGKQLLIPRSADRVVCHYNKKVIKDAEEATGQEILKYIKNGWTWDDFNTVCDLLNQYEPYRDDPNQPLVDSNCNWEAVFNPIFQHFGVKYFDEDKNLALDSPQTKEALDFFKNWGDKGYIGKNGKEANFTLPNGKGVMFFQSLSISDVESLLEKRYPTRPSNVPMTEYYDVVTMPVFEDDPRIGAGAAGYCAYYRTANPSLVWAFMKHVLSKEGQNAIADAGSHYVPIRKDMADYNDPENHWGAGYTGYNLAAFTWEPDWNCYTDYFIAPGYADKAVALNDIFGAMIKSYVDGKSYDAVMSPLEKQVKSALGK